MPASYASTSYSPDNLIACSDDLLTRSITLASGQSLARGTVLGQITLGAASSAAKVGGNTGNGTLVLDATTPILAFAIAGVYTVRAIQVGTNLAVFAVVDPRGVALGNVVISGSGSSATFANRIKFAITDGATDFALGDGFDITIAAGNGKYVQSLAAALDGSQTPDLILADTTDASAGDKTTVAYVNGSFIEAGLILGAGHTLDSIREGLRVKDIQLVKGIAI